MPAVIDIIRRRPVIPLDAAIAGNWYQRRATEDLLNTLSFAFPAAEKFFIESVNHYQPRIKDPALAEAARRFLFQEAMHVRGHASCNDVLRGAWPLGHRIQKLTERIFAALRVLPHWWRLAVTCALEHFTAMLADHILDTREVFLARSDPAFASLWLWHAVEETEHKAVCFDLLQAVMGKGVRGYVLRVAAMLVVTICFLAFALLGPRLLGRRGKGAGPGLGTLMKQILSLKLYLDYYRWSFHPWDHDNAHLVAQWRERYPGFGEA